MGQSSTMVHETNNMHEIFEIALKNCAFYGYHGVLEAEKQLGQRFYVDVRVRLVKPEKIETDDLAVSVDYGKIFDLVKAQVEAQRYDLIETLAHFIGKDVCQEFDCVYSAIVTVRKPAAPIKGQLDYAEVTVETRA